MPKLSVWLIRCALLHLLIGSLLGTVMLLTKAGATMPGWVLRGWGVHAELVLVGWMVQLTIGVAYWILPKFPRRPVRGPSWPVVAALVLLNAGVVAAGLASLQGWRELVVVARFAELAAVMSFALSTWPRVKEFGRGRPAAL